MLTVLYKNKKNRKSKSRTWGTPDRSYSLEWVLSNISDLVSHYSSSNSPKFYSVWRILFLLQTLKHHTNVLCTEFISHCKFTVGFAAEAQHVMLYFWPCIPSKYLEALVPSTKIMMLGIAVEEHLAHIYVTRWNSDC